MKFIKRLMYLIAIIFVPSCTGYRILGLFPFNAHSHNIMFEAIVKGLAKRGHHVDLVTHFPIKNAHENVHTIINLKGTLENLINNFSFHFASTLGSDGVTYPATHFGNRLCDMMGLKEMQNLIRNPPSDPSYDVLLTEVIRKMLISIVFAAFVTNCIGFRILGIFPFNGHSHNIMFEAVAKGLAKKGHHVDLVTQFPVENSHKNLHNIVNLNGTVGNLVNNVSINFAMNLGSDGVPYMATHFGNRLCDLMGMKEMENLIKNPPTDPPYDVLLTEVFGANCFFGFGKLFNIPIVALASAVEYPWISDFLGNADNLAIVPTAFTDASNPMSFWQRLNNVITHYDSMRRFYAYTEEAQTLAMRKYLKPDMPGIREVEKNISLTLVNSHPILFGNKPVSPSVVQVAGIHILEDDAKFTPELKKWMDESTSGVVFFTLGSMVVIETLPNNTIAAIYSSFAKIKPMRVLMKIVDAKKLPRGLPDNIKTSSWIPQIPVLGHKNTRVFITHGGLMGTQEALHFGVPLIGIPIFGDQKRNVESYVSKGMALLMNINNITEQSLDNALQAVLHDPKYRLNAQYQSKLFKDRPMNSMDTAIFWIEYVIRNGPDILKSPAIQFSWWQVALLDVYGFILLVIIFIVFVVIFIISTIYETLLGSSTKQNKRNKID